MKKINRESVSLSTIIIVETMVIVLLLLILMAAKFELAHMNHIEKLIKNTLKILSLLFVIIDLHYFLHRMEKRYRGILLALLGTILLSSLPLFVNGLYGQGSAHDLDFHLMRIEGLAEELKRGVFPVRMQSLWMDGYGYPVSVFYGDAFLYFPALLRLLGFSVTTSYLCFVFGINCITVLLSYASFRRIFRDQQIAALVSFAYSTASYRLMDIFIRAAVGEYCAIAFFPLLALAIYNIYTEDCSAWKNYRRNALLLMIGMSGILQSHILSCEMAVILLVLVCVVLWKKTFRWNTIRVYFLAALGTILLNLFFLVPFVDYFLNVPVKINSGLHDSIMYIQGSGVYLAQLFAFCQFPSGYDRANIGERMVMTPGFLLMAALIGGIILIIDGNANRKIKITLFFSVLSLWISSSLFPWNWLAEHFKFGNLMAQVQFPWRYIAIAMVFLSLLMGFSIKEFYHLHSKYASHAMTIMVLVSLCFSLVFLSQYCDLVYNKTPRSTTDLDPFSVIGGEYLRSGDNGDFSSLPESDFAKQLYITSRDGSKMELFCEVGDTDAIIVIPIFHYKGYQITDESGFVYELFDGPNNKISFRVPAGFSGNLSVRFVPPWYWRTAEAVSLFMLAGILFVLIRKNSRRKASSCAPKYYSQSLRDS